MLKTLTARFFDLKVEEIADMEWDSLPVVDTDTDLESVLGILRDKDHLWVVDNCKNRILQGVITEKDFLDVLSPPKIKGFVFGMPEVRSLHMGNVEVAADIMTKKAITCKRTAKLGDVIENMRFYRVKRMPVVEGKRLVSEVTLNLLIKKYHDALNYIDVTR